MGQSPATECRSAVCPRTWGILRTETFSVLPTSSAIRPHGRIQAKRSSGAGWCSGCRRSCALLAPPCEAGRPIGRGLASFASPVCFEVTRRVMGAVAASPALLANDSPLPAGRAPFGFYSRLTQPGHRPTPGSCRSSLHHQYTRQCLQCQQPSSGCLKNSFRPLAHRHRRRVDYTRPLPLMAPRAAATRIGRPQRA
jgi:hypothetical protein